MLIDILSQQAVIIEKPMSDKEKFENCLLTDCKNVEIFVDEEGFFKKEGSEKRRCLGIFGHAFWIHEICEAYMEKRKGSKASGFDIPQLRVRYNIEEPIWVRESGYKDMDDASWHYFS